MDVLLPKFFLGGDKDGWYTCLQQHNHLFGVSWQVTRLAQVAIRCWYISLSGNLLIMLPMPRRHGPEAEVDSSADGGNFSIQANIRSLPIT